MRCELCGNENDRILEVRIGNESHFFDSFECAIHALAPVCPHCSCRVIGHGVQRGDDVYCCEHCAGAHGS